MQTLANLDYLVFFIYFIIIVGYGLWVYRKKKKAEASSNDYFLAEGSLTWWAIGASLIASNISAEQFIGMSGSGFKMGLAIATYEWMAAATSAEAKSSRYCRPSALPNVCQASWPTARPAVNDAIAMPLTTSSGVQATAPARLASGNASAAGHADGRPGGCES